MRVVVAGPPGAGKTHLAARLAAHTALPLHDLDDLYWAAGWSRPGSAEWHARQLAVTSQERWIIAGNFQATLHVRLRRATHLVIVDPGPARCLVRLARRTLGIYLGRVEDLPRALRATGRLQAGRGLTGIARTALRYRRVELPATHRLAAAHRLRPVFVGRDTDAADLLTRLNPTHPDAIRCNPTGASHVPGRAAGDQLA
ncbi:hypothetical protein ACIBKX_33880 [Streptomyces sp. NPDC050658]|uniref:hypothetical protein n=1 Tax=unclassified Streptomyces TaxID=2593676 RepID=UPI00343AAB1D